MNRTAKRITVLPDTSVWIDHLSRPDADLVSLLNAGDVLLHPFVIGEIALGNLRDRKRMLWFLGRIDAPKSAEPHEVLALIESRQLAGTGIGYVDAHLLASCLLTPHCGLWTRDRRLRTVAESLGVAAAHS